MDAELKQALEAIGAKIGAIDAKIGAMDAKIGAMDTKIGSMDAKIGAIDTKIGAMDAKIGSIELKVGSMDGKMGAMEARLVERIHDSETRLLSAFYSWASPMEIRVNKQMPAMDERLGLLEARIAALERKDIERHH